MMWSARVFILGWLVISAAEACSVFNKLTSDGRVWVGRNLDWVASSGGRIGFLPPSEDRYGAVLFFIDDDVWPQGGLNDQGLVLGMTATPFLPITPHPDRQPMGWDFWDTLFQTCATVDDVLHYLNRFDLSSVPGYLESGQMLWTDRHGDSTIVEGDVVFPGNGDFQVITNFLQSHPHLGGYPCPRFDLLHQMLADDDRMDETYFLEALERAHGTRWGGYTVYSNFYDLREGEVTLFYRGDFSRPKVMDLAEELEKGVTGYDMDTLFGPESSATHLHAYYLSEVWSGSDDCQTHIMIINPNTHAVSITIEGFGVTGTCFATPWSSRELDPLGMMGFTVADAFLESQAQVAWIRVRGDRDLDVMAELRCGQRKMAYWAGTHLRDRLRLPHVAQDTAMFQTQVALVNGIESGSDAVLVDYPQNEMRILDALGFPFSKVLLDPAAIYDDLSTLSWIDILGEERSLAGMEYFQYVDGRMSTAGIGLDGRSSRTLIFPHVAADTSQFWTGLVAINVGSTPALVSRTAFAASGDVLGEDEVALLSYEKLTMLFDAEESSGLPGGTAWIRLQADQDLVGYALFGAANQAGHDYFAGLQSVCCGGHILRFPWFENTSETWSGFALLNAGDEMAQVRVSLLRDNGRMEVSDHLNQVEAHAKVVLMGDQLFPGLDLAAGHAWVRVQASSPNLVGFLLWGDRGQPQREHLAGVVARSR